ncbi:MAG: hypothetical protein C4K49_04390 [Candidatus Thorarchaeota archaeon]|nr:MAG: hypothetical protein C4K49_04390 [Candidatus Thorarchaeota archaeon]
MVYYLYIYDCRHARQANARRVSFTKDLYGFDYSWRTRTGVKQGRRRGLLDECVGAKAVTDSAILVPEEHRLVFDALFRTYQDILETRIYEVLTEIR